MTISMVSSSFDPTPGLRLGTELAGSQPTTLSGSGTRLNLNDGTLISPALELTNSAVMSGIGVIEGSVKNAGRIDVDIGPRNLKIIGDYRQAGDGILTLQTRTGAHSQLEVTQSADVAGTINILASSRRRRMLASKTC